MSHHVYIVECSDGTLYTGYTTDIERRIREHNASDGAKYTRGRTPVELRHSETFADKGSALAREHAIKRLSRDDKDALCSE